MRFNSFLTVQVHERRNRSLGKQQKKNNSFYTIRGANKAQNNIFFITFIRFVIIKLKGQQQKQ